MGIRVEPLDKRVTLQVGLASDLRKSITGAETGIERALVVCAISVYSGLNVRKRKSYVVGT